MATIIQQLNEWTLFATALWNLMKYVAPITLAIIWICRRLELIRYAHKIWTAYKAMAFRSAPWDKSMQRKTEYLCLWLETISTSLGAFAYFLVTLLFLFATIYVIVVQPSLFPFRILVGFGIVVLSLSATRIFFVDFQFAFEKLFKSK